MTLSRRGRWLPSIVLPLLMMSVPTGFGEAAPPWKVVPEPALRPAPNTCARQLVVSPQIAPGPIDAERLVRLRDIGTSSDEGTYHAPISLSPDRRSVAFVIRRGDPVANRVCAGLFVLSLTNGAAPKLIDIGGDPVVATFASSGFGAFPSGTLTTIEPKWSRDGQWVAFLKRTDGHIRVWRARADGGGSEIAASLPEDIDDFAWSPDGTRMLLSSRPGLLAAEQAIDREGFGGWLYDARAFPIGTQRPLPLIGPPTVLQVVTLKSDAVRPATTEDAAWLHPRVAGAPDDAIHPVPGPGGSLAWRSPGSISQLARTDLTARIAGKESRCSVHACVGNLIGPWWADDGRSLLFARYGASEDGLTRFYRWTPRTGEVRPIRDEDALYVGCQQGYSGLVCLREDPATPRQIVLLDPDNGRRRLLFDPNPDISGRFQGRIERLVWSDAQGVRTFGHLILPPSYRSGARLPLVVVQYRAAGFQRGGVGDEAPILPLANDGFAVLNFERPQLPGNFPSVGAYMRTAMAGWMEERSVLSALEAGVHQLIHRGIVDPDRIGLHGLSAGAQTGQFALIHSHLFKAVSLSTCCKDPVGTMAESGPGIRAAEEAWGLPPITSGNIAQWRDVSLALNVDHITTPILLQLADWEFRESLQTVAAFRALDRPLELRVFPGEVHGKQQPAHRLAIYQRNIDWFDFWLRDRENDGPSKTQEYARWRQWKAQLRAATP